MLAELAKPSRADRYEQWGHLLMAQGESAVMGRHEITLSNMMGDGEPITIPLDPSSSLIENAERYYAKARKTREARHHADSRWNDVEAERDTAARLLDRLQTIHTLADLEGFKNEEKDALASLAGDHPENQEVLPYRQFYVAGWEIRVGKHARGECSAYDAPRWSARPLASRPRRAGLPCRHPSPQPRRRTAQARCNVRRAAGCPFQQCQDPVARARPGYRAQVRPTYQGRSAWAGTR